MRTRTEHVLVLALIAACQGSIVGGSDDPGGCIDCGVDGGTPGGGDGGVVERPDAGAAAGPTRTEVGPRGVIHLDGAPMFPIGLSMGPTTDGLSPRGASGLDEVAAAGINFVRINPSDDAFSDVENARGQLDAVASRGIHAWMNLKNLSSAAAGSAEETRLRDVVSALRDHPGLGLWKGADEPWWGDKPAASLRPAYDAARAADPDHVLVMIQAPRGTDADLQPYSTVTDVHGVDVYPVAYGVTNPDLHQLGVWTKRIQGITPNQAVFSILQVCFAGSDSADGTAYVMPTPRQERYMIYDAIMNGARGLFFFGGNPPYTYCMEERDKGLGWNWKFWDEVLEPLVREIGPKSELYPALLAPGTGLGLTVGGTGTVVHSRVVGEKDVWVIVARHGAGTVNATVGGLPADVSTGSVYTENRSVTANGGSFTDSIGQWGVHVYRFTKP